VEGISSRRMLRYYDSSKWEKCVKCQEVKFVEKRTDEGEPICPKCNRKTRDLDVATHERCAGCNQIRPVRGRTQTGNAICKRCYDRIWRKYSERKECCECHKLKLVATKREDGSPICHSCFHSKKIGKCVDCNRIKVIVAKDRCSRCYVCQWRKKFVVDPA